MDRSAETDARFAEAGKQPDSRSLFRRSLRGVFYVCLIVAAVFLGGFLLFAEHVSKLSTPSDIAASDGIVVLTGGHFRLEAATELISRHKGERLLISGVNPDTTLDAIRQTTGAEKQVFDCCVDIDRAADTIGNARETVGWIRRNTFDDIILVTNNYHMPRSLLEIQQVAPDITVHPYPVVNSDLTDGRWLAKPDALRVIFTEYVKYVLAIMRNLSNVADIERSTTGSIASAAG